MSVSTKSLEQLLKAAGLKNAEVDSSNLVNSNTGTLSNFGVGAVVTIPEDFVCYPSKNKQFKGASAGVTAEGMILWPSQLIKTLAEVEGTQFTGRVLRPKTQLAKDLGSAPSYEDVYKCIRGKKLTVLNAPECRVAIWKDGKVVDSTTKTLRIFEYADANTPANTCYELS